ncbi:MAG: hypothetical protein ACKERF_01800 [Candidatus Hodgkinia cicadicola]
MRPIQLCETTFNRSTSPWAQSYNRNCFRNVQRSVPTYCALTLVERFKPPSLKLPFHFVLERFHTITSAVANAT